jgi:sugar O-acyltransferase (sialic acid O-acetyltransferase NeuD family)
MSRPLVIVGCGGFGREVWSIVRALEVAGESWQLEGFVDDDPSPMSRSQVEELGSNLVADVSELAERKSPYSAVLAVGTPSIRERIWSKLTSSSVTYPVLVHPDATIGGGVRLGAGTVVAPGARLSTNIELGSHVQIDQNVTVGHDTVVGDFARLNPGACVSGSVCVGRRALIGANATVLPSLDVGEDAIVGAAACVVRSTAPGNVVKGVPAR